MTWEISHTGKAWDQVETNLRHWTNRDLITALAYDDVNALYEKSDEAWSPGTWADVEAKCRTKYDSYEHEQLVQSAMDAIRMHNSCSNGGHEFYITKDGHWRVSCSALAPYSEQVSHVTLKNPAQDVSVDRAAASNILCGWGGDMVYLSEENLGRRDGARLLPGHYLVFREGDVVRAALGEYATPDQALSEAQRMLARLPQDTIGQWVELEKILKAEIAEGRLGKVERGQDLKGGPRL